MLYDFYNETVSSAPVSAIFSESASAASVGRRQIQCTEGNSDFDCVNSFPLAMAYVPMQKFECLYSPDAALEAGTLFEALDLPFTAYKGGKNK